MSGMTPNRPITWGMKDPYDEFNYGSGATPADEERASWQDVADDVPPTVCIRHGRHVPCRNDKDSCLTTSHPVMVAMVGAYQANTDGVRWDFEHVVKSWIYMQKKGEGNW
jgi:hypothetical protein